MLWFLFAPGAAGGREAPGGGVRLGVVFCREQLRPGVVSRPRGPIGLA